LGGELCVEGIFKRNFPNTYKYKNTIVIAERVKFSLKEIFLKNFFLSKSQKIAMGLTNRKKNANYENTYLQDSGMMEFYFY